MVLAVKAHEQMRHCWDLLFRSHDGQASDCLSMSPMLMDRTTEAPATRHRCIKVQSIWRPASTYHRCTLEPKV